MTFNQLANIKNIRILLSGISLVLFCFGESIGQNLPKKKKAAYTSEISIGYGYGDINLTWLNFATVLGSFGGQSYSNIGVAHISYMQEINRTFDIGGTLAYSSGRINEISKGKEQKIASVNHFTALINGRICYLSKTALKLYSGIGIGAQLTSEKSTIQNLRKQNDVRVSFHITGIGVKFGKKIGGFTEVGFGDKGIISAGTYWRF
ncbi:hypothetical protein KTO58_14265 [Chitinophaga pendula]|uniref:hypothetical protein n=1 Tax=Chitinophaga TaxID=79328 RepID=UPI000BB080C1|nr:MULTISPECIES: hypothetical protein [Chitinophaga]ASZ12096.1 hypothetical protein CK934_14565 [Chitinophaga sp. MD30]UCJ04867.1 hypothetical protein KTO58_14265 [Chitinophaga pendula]